LVAKADDDIEFPGTILTGVNTLASVVFRQTHPHIRGHARVIAAPIAKASEDVHETLRWHRDCPMSNVGAGETAEESEGLDCESSQIVNGS